MIFALLFWLMPSMGWVFFIALILLCFGSLAVQVGWLPHSLSSPLSKLANFIPFLPKNNASTQRSVSQYKPQPKSRPKQKDREEVSSQSIQTLEGLLGVHSFEEIDDFMTRVDKLDKEQVRTNSYASSALVVLLSGANGVGKSTTAKSISELMFGIGVTDTPNSITLRQYELAQDPIATILAVPDDMPSGTVIYDNIDWALASDIGQTDLPIQRIGEGILRLAEYYPKRYVHILTGAQEQIEKIEARDDFLVWRSDCKILRVSLGLPSSHDLATIFETELHLAGYIVTRRAKDRAIKEFRGRSDMSDAYQHAKDARQLADTVATAAAKLLSGDSNQIDENILDEVFSR